MVTEIVNDFGDQARNFTGEGCRDLPVLVVETEGKPNVHVSCWQFSPEQIKAITENDGKVYLYVWGMQPPVYIDHENPLK